MNDNRESKLNIETDDFYLSDEELEALISEVEESDEVEAPGYLLDNILGIIDREAADKHAAYAEDENKLPEPQIAKPPKVKDIMARRRAYRIYCAKIIAGAAAAIALLVVLPLVNDKRAIDRDRIEKTLEVKEVREIPDREMYLDSVYVSREEVEDRNYYKIKRQLGKLNSYFE